MVCLLDLLLNLGGVDLILELGLLLLSLLLDGGGLDLIFDLGAIFLVGGLCLLLVIGSLGNSEGSDLLVTLVGCKSFRYCICHSLSEILMVIFGQATGRGSLSCLKRSLNRVL